MGSFRQCVFISTQDRGKRRGRVEKLQKTVMKEEQNHSRWMEVAGGQQHYTQIKEQMDNGGEEGCSLAFSHRFKRFAAVKS